MQAEYKKELGSLYMVIAAEGKTGGYEERAVLGNKIPELLETHYNAVDGEGAYYYDITGYSPLEKYLAMRQINYSELSNMLTQVIRLPEKLEAYLISDKHIILEPQGIYIDKAGNKLGFCLFPAGEGDYMEGLRNLALYFLKKIDHQDEACVSLAYEFFDLVSGDGCEVKELKKLCGQETGQERVYGSGENPEFTEASDEDDEEKLWDVDPMLKEPPKDRQGIKKELLLKAAGIGAPVAAVIVVGILLFL